MKAIRFVALAGLVFLLLPARGAARADGPFTPTYSQTADEVSPDDPYALPADDECPVGAPCKVLWWTEIPDGQPSAGISGILPSSIVALAGDALVPDGAIVGRLAVSERVGPSGNCAGGSMWSFAATFLDATTDASTTTGSASDLCSFSRWPTQLNGVRDGFLAANPGAALYARWVLCGSGVTVNDLLFTQADGSVLYTAVVGDPAVPETVETCGPWIAKSVQLGLSADNPDTPEDEGGIPLWTCTTAGTQTFRILLDRRDTPPGDLLMLEDTAICSSNTPAGSGVSVPLNGGTEALAGMDVTFSNVTSGGTTNVVTSTEGPPPPTGFEIVGLAELPLYFDINTDASYSGDVTVCVRYDETQVEGPESDLRLMHRVGDSYADVTTSVDAVAHVICGRTTGLSVFVVAQPLPPPTPTPPSGVGGVVEFQRGPSAPSAQQPGSAAPPYVALAGAAAAAALALAAGAWYTKRRWIR